MKQHFLVSAAGLRSVLRRIFLMFSINDTVLYGTVGVCRVEGISEIALGREKKKYYVLKPVSQGSATVYVPLDNDSLLSKVRKLLTRGEIDAMIKNVTCDDVWVEDDTERARLFSDTVKSGDRALLISMIHTLITHRRKLSGVGKKLHLADERALRDAERLLCDEFSYVLGIAPETVGDYVTSGIDRAKA
jgi:CarD family transcriptional regulator